MASGEFALIARYFSSLGAGAAVDVSVGDDCALLSLNEGERLATSIDTLVAGRHFFPDTFPEDIGYRCVAVAVSDLAAMGARPLGMTLALTLPEADDFWLHAFSEGLAQACSQYTIPLVGGDTTRGPLTMSVSVFGALPHDQSLLRSGAKVGDRVCVSGPLGDAAAALAFIQEQWQPEPDHGEYLLQRFHRPTARLSLGRSLLGSATAAIDISDGLLADVGHIATASGVKVVIDCERLPLSEAVRSHPTEKDRLRWALSGGDDYELCFCLPAWCDVPSGTYCIGHVLEGEGVECDGAAHLPAGYNHF